MRNLLSMTDSAGVLKVLIVSESRALYINHSLGQFRILAKTYLIRRPYWD